MDSSDAYPVIFFIITKKKTCAGSDNLARCGALESLVNDMADDTWDNKAVNRISAIHFLDDDEDEDDEKVRPAGSEANFHCNPPSSRCRSWPLG